MPSTRNHGVVCHVNVERGFGFVREVCPNCGAIPNGQEGQHACVLCGAALQDYFFHFKQVYERDVICVAEPGYPLVEFCTLPTPKGIQAAGVKLANRKAVS